MTVILVLSLVSAVFWIFASFTMYAMSPILEEFIQNGEMEKLVSPYSAVMNENDILSMTEAMSSLARIDTKYWLFQLILYIASLAGVIKMFKYDKLGFHIYSISNILLLINASIYLYPVQPQSSFWSDLILTLILIMLYNLYFKRMEIVDNHHQ